MAFVTVTLSVVMLSSKILSLMLNVTNKYIILSVVRLSVVTLNVVAPISSASQIIFLARLGMC
jgi:hypothetical protein